MYAAGLFVYSQHIVVLNSEVLQSFGNQIFVINQIIKITLITV